MSADTSTDSIPYPIGYRFLMNREEYYVSKLSIDPLYRYVRLTPLPHLIGLDIAKETPLHISTLENLPPILNLPKYRGKEGEGYFRPMSLEEAKTLKGGETLWAKTLGGDVRRVKINGKAKVWKRDKDRVEVPFKYGMYEYGRFDTSDIAKGVLLVEVRGS